MARFYITFGQVHSHHIPNHTLDKDTVAVIDSPDDINEAMRRVSELFGNKYCMISSSLPNMEHFPKGLVEV